MPRGKKKCSSCDIFVGSRASKCSCGYVFDKKTNSKKINKLEVLSRLVIVPEKNKRPFYLKEFKMMKSLTERYSLEFLLVVDFGKKFDSLAYLVSPKLKDSLDQRWRAFNYKFDKSKYSNYNIGEKFGDDKQLTKKNKTTRDFLNE
tara:strand:+ start:1070 stop:1507 length:438 start_codon:yes stop_codon:yes gene_type:complete